MEGEVGRLKEIVEIKKKYKARLLTALVNYTRAPSAPCVG